MTIMTVITRSNTFQNEGTQQDRPCSGVSGHRTFHTCGAIVWSLCMLLLAVKSVNAQQLPGTTLLEPHADRSSAMRAGFRKYLLAETEASIQRRAPLWKRDCTSLASYEKSIAPNRARFRQMIGAVDDRLPVEDLELVATTKTPSMLAENERYSVRRVRWPVFPGVYGEGLLLEPKSPRKANVIAIPDADQTPEQICGLTPGVESERQFARRLAEAGCRVVVPVLVNRQSTWSGNPDVAMTNQSHREWIYRPAFEMGRHIIGYEVQRVLALVDWMSHGETKIRIGVAGYAEGGLVALYSAALDSRIDACLVSGYFQSRQQIRTEPISRNLFGLLKEFGDAEIASLIAPRPVIIEHSNVPVVSHESPVPAGRLKSAAPGELKTPAFDSVRSEVERCRNIFQADSTVRASITLVAGEKGATVGPVSSRAIETFCESLSVDKPVAEKTPKASVELDHDFIRERQRRAVQQLVDYTQGLLRHSPQVRDKFWIQAKPTGGADQWKKDTQHYRDYLWDEVVGRLPAATLPANPRTRRIYDRPKWTGYEVVLDVHQDVICWGYLLVPKDLKPGERRPVVVCQHGLEGHPADTVIDDPESQAYQYYKSFSAKLADRGFVVYAPHNFYRGANAFRQLQRIAHPLKLTLFGITTAQHARHLEWLSSLSFVDDKRIGFYGLSYGGNTAMRVPALLTKYAAVICSGDFNEWIYKNVTMDDLKSMIYHNVYEVFEWNLGHTFNHGDLAALIAPRPFMVERGHDDGVGIDEWVASEFARVRRLYAKLGISDRTEIEFFNGPHTIHGEGTFEFLHRHLKHPVK